MSAEPMPPAEPPRQAQQYRQPAPAPEAQQPVRPARNLGRLKWVVVAVVAVAVMVASWFLLPRNGDIAATIDSDKYQAVHLSNGQVYFGKLTIVNSDFMQLTNVFYLERQLTASADDSDSETDTSNPQAGSENSFQLLKYSDVLYGSEDAMIISRDDIVRYENLRSDGVVAKAIANRR